MSDTERRISGWLLPAGLAALVIALVAIALLRGPTALDPDTPEGTVQEYLLAVNEARWDDAVEILHEDWRGSCDGPDLASHSHDNFTAELGDQTGFGNSGIRREVEPPIPGDQSSPTIPDTTTEVVVTLHYNEGADLGSGWSESVVFELVNEDDFWWLVGDPWPYFVWSCQTR